MQRAIVYSGVYSAGSKEQEVEGKRAVRHREDTYLGRAVGSDLVLTPCSIF